MEVCPAAAQLLKTYILMWTSACMHAAACGRGEGFAGDAMDIVVSTAELVVTTVVSMIMWVSTFHAKSHNEVQVCGWSQLQVRLLQCMLLTPGAARS